MAYEYDMYITNKDGVKETVEKYGVAIIPSVLDADECNRIVDGLWEYFAHLTSKWQVPLDRNKPETWREIYKLMPLHSMLFQYFSAGHAQVVWDVRQNEKIVDIFATLWGVKKEDLLVSFDGLSFNMPPEVTRRGWNLENTWFHTDQSYTRPDMEIIQSWVTGLDVREGDATLAFMEGSNRYHREFAEKFNVTDKSDWHKLTKEEETFYVEKGCAYKKIRCPKGSMVFWDSRTIHCGAEAMRGRAEANFRAVVYVCMMPKTVCDDKNLKKRLQAFEDLRTSNHYPHKVKLFPKMPRTYGNVMEEITKISAPHVTELGRSLVGFK